MKKIIVSIFACLALTFGSAVAVSSPAESYPWTTVNSFIAINPSNPYDICSGYIKHQDNLFGYPFAETYLDCTQPLIHKRIILIYGDGQGNWGGADAYWSNFVFGPAGWTSINGCIEFITLGGLSSLQCNVL